MGASVSSIEDVNPLKHAKKSQVLEIQTNKQWKLFSDSLVHTNKLVVIDFTATWCPPCKSMEATIKDLALKYPDITFIRIDVDKLTDVAKAYKVDALPAFVFIKKDKEVDRLVGAKVDELHNKIQQHHK